MAGRLADKVAIVTGGASGMGRSGGIRFLEEGARVVVGDLNEENGNTFIEELTSKGFGSSARFVRADVSDEGDTRAMVQSAIENFGRLDVMWNNAGIGGAFGPITDVSVEDWDFTFAVLVRGVFLGTKHAAKAMISQGTGGSIINTASVAALGGGLAPHAYSGAKAAVVNFTMTSAVELGPNKIRANAILPGGILTPLMHQGKPEEAGKVFEEIQPIGRVGVGEDIADAALFLASDESSFISGESLKVDGGLMAVGAKHGGRLAGSEKAHEVAGVNRGTTGVRSEWRKLED
ncbi:SDR family oxidoreductase [Myxococcota bacterium]|nr:SDR family oxidoreductase [Myxococcota bacterium]